MVTIVADPESCSEMQPEIMPGDTLYIAPEERTGESGIYVIEYKGNQKFCRLTTTACGKWLEELETLKICGKVIKQVREY